MKKTFYLPILLLLAYITACSSNGTPAEEEQSVEPQHTILYGIIADNYRTENGIVGKGETLGKILSGYGITAVAIDKLDKVSQEIFPLRKIQADTPYTAFIAADSTGGGKLDYLVYEKDLIEYVVFGFKNDSITVTTGQKDVTIRRQKRSSVIESSLWGAIMRDSLPYALAAEMEE